MAIDPKKIPANPFTIPCRSLKHSYVKGDLTQTMHLEEVRDYLRKLQRAMDPTDVYMPLLLMGAHFEGGRMTVSLNENVARRHNLPASGILVMSNGASHLHREVLPSRFWAGFKQLAKLNPARAHGVWEDFANLQTRRRVVRTVRMKMGDEVYRAVRAVVSSKHNLYSNVAMVEDILAHAGHFASMPVLSWHVTDTGMRIRFVGLDPALAALAGFDPTAALQGEVVPMIDVGNSEVGRAVTWMSGGLYNLKTASGLGHWDENRSFRWRHVGKQSRITARVQSTFTTLTQTAQEVVQAYTDACDVEVEDPEKWLRQRLGGMKGVPDRVLEAAVKALNDPNVTPGGKVATVIDALTLAVHDEKDIYTAQDVENATSRLLQNAHLDYEVEYRIDGSTRTYIPKPKEK